MKTHYYWLAIAMAVFTLFSFGYTGFSTVEVEGSGSLFTVLFVCGGIIVISVLTWFFSKE